MKNVQNNRAGDEIALERFKIISPILSAIESRTDDAKIGMLKSEICGLAGIGRKKPWTLAYSLCGKRL